MLSNSRKPASGTLNDFVKVFERWLISITDMPTPGKRQQIALRLFQNRHRMIAGPALKLKIRSVISFEFGIWNLS